MFVSMEDRDAPDAATAATWVVNVAESWAVACIEEDIMSFWGTAGSAAAEEMSALVPEEEASVEARLRL